MGIELAGVGVSDGQRTLDRFGHADSHKGVLTSTPTMSAVSVD